MDFPHSPTASPFELSPSTYLATHSDPRYSYLATGALVFDTSSPSAPKILLLQRAAGDSMPNKWEVPGGGCDDEDPSILYSAARELREETGLKAKYIEGPVGEAEIFTSRSGKKIGKFSFRVQTEVGNVVLDPKEHQAFVWATEEETRAKRVRNLELAFTKEAQEHTILEAFNHLRDETVPKRTEP